MTDQTSAAPATTPSRPVPDEAEHRARRAMLAERVNASLRAGDWRGASLTLAEILEIDPANIPALTTLGTIFRDIGAYRQAEDMLMSACELDPRAVPPLCELARLRRAQGLPWDAMRLFRDALRRMPGMAEVWPEFLEVLHELDAASDLAVTVIMPTTGSEALPRAVNSVLNQVHPTVEALVVTDGPAFHQRAMAVLGDLAYNPRVKILALPYNTGADGLNGHRIYGASTFLADGHFLAFLDEDNWYEPDHLAGLARLAVDHKLPWAFSLRRCWDADGNFHGPDNCESLGWWPAWTGKPHVDTNCYFMRRDVALSVASLWYRPHDRSSTPDREICLELLKSVPNCGTTGAFTVNYTIGGTGFSVRSEFIRRGNAAMEERYGGTFPWLQPQARRLETGNAPA